MRKLAALAAGVGLALAIAVPVSAGPPSRTPAVHHQAVAAPETPAATVTPTAPAEAPVPPATPSVSAAPAATERALAPVSQAPAIVSTPTTAPSTAAPTPGPQPATDYTAGMCIVTWGASSLTDPESGDATGPSGGSFAMNCDAARAWTPGPGVTVDSIEPEPESDNPSAS